MADLNNLENKIIKMESKIDMVLEKLADNKIAHDEMKAMVREMDSRKANVWVETAITRLNWLVIISVVGGLIAVVLK